MEGPESSREGGSAAAGLMEGRYWLPRCDARHPPLPDTTQTRPGPPTNSLQTRKGGDYNIQQRHVG